MTGARRIVGLAAGGRPGILAANLNDPPRGPVRRVLANGGFDGLDAPAATSVFTGSKKRFLGVVASRGTTRSAVTVRPAADVMMPGADWPSDHAAILVDLSV